MSEMTPRERAEKIADACGSIVMDGIFSRHESNSAEDVHTKMTEVIEAAITEAVSSAKAEMELRVAALKSRLDLHLNAHLCEMKEGYDDSIVGFNEAWDVMREVFGALPTPAAYDAAKGLIKAAKAFDESLSIYCDGEWRDDLRAALAAAAPHFGGGKS